ncbi:MAG: HIT family protein [Deltaproteobacteria bacterium]|nr:HIT family protein [Deltaproteobacteria bacterium]NCP03767.1 HIT family protein [Deltaproteobacteria bacterium]NCP78473.1 HIT family protein [Desulfuromonadales bacterium]
MTNPTLDKFGYPESLIEETFHWVVLLRPAQVTLGSLVLVCKEPVQALSDLSMDAFVELQQVIERVERSLHKTFDYDKINYLMLMMVDPDVHFHIIPRYSAKRIFEGVELQDTGWPGPPDLASCNELNTTTMHALRRHLLTIWG